ncbi:MAG: hypothetical protein LBI87_00495 [Candidatus Accumulibacter sp.]|nr:hypothetical protein [Accumulibacter sp.]
MVFCVIGISEVAKRIHPKVAGVLMGLPFGAGISAYFFAYEQGADFAMETVPWSITGLVSTLIFALAYLWAGQRYRALPRVPGVAVASTVSVAAWGVSTFLLRQVPMNLFGAACLFAFSVAGNLRLLKKFPSQGSKTSDKASSLDAILFRALAAGVTISVITGFAGMMGPSWSGLLGPFPVLMLPLLLVLHFEDGEKVYPGVVHAYARSVTNLFLFYLGLYVLLPRVGLNATFLVLYPLSGLYLWALGRRG